MDPVSETADLPFAEALEAHSGPIVGDGNYDTALFADLEFTDARGDGARFIECAFSSVTFAGGRLRRARFNEVWMRAAAMVGTDLAETEWLDSALLSAKLAGVQAYDAKLRRIRFSGCKLDGVNLRGAELIDVDFTDCTLSDVDFADATLTGVRFSGSALRGVRLDHATLSKADLRGATELDVASGHRALAGSIITTTQLIGLGPALAKELGITVKDR